MPGKYYSEPIYGDFIQPEGGGGISTRKKENARVLCLVPGLFVSRRSFRGNNPPPPPAESPESPLPSHASVVPAILPSLCLWILVRLQLLGSWEKQPRGKSNALTFLGRSGSSSPGESPRQPSEAAGLTFPQPGSVRSRPAFPSAPPPACACVCAR